MRTRGGRDGSAGGGLEGVDDGRREGLLAAAACMRGADGAGAAAARGSARRPSVTWV